jgi:hypothetical protein
VHPQPLAGVGADETVKRARGRYRGRVNPCSPGPSRRLDDGKDVQNVVASGLSAAGRYDEGRPLARREGCRTAVDQRDSTEKLRSHRASLRRWHLVDHHRDCTTLLQDRSGTLHRAFAGRQEHASARSSFLPESVDPRGAQMLGHDEKRAPPGHGAGREIPVTRVGSRNNDPASTGDCLVPNRSRLAGQADMALRRFVSRCEP